MNNSKENKERLATFINNVTKDTSKETGARIIVFDDLPPEATAMIQALNSRSAGGFYVNANKVLEEEWNDFMSKFYIKYGHKSIADCGSTTLMFDGISMLAAKALQDWPLYNGQETSTRFIDVDGLGIVNPSVNNIGQDIFDRWFAFYRDERPELIEFLKEANPWNGVGNKDSYEKTINARSFDILRSFLPAGAKTNASWHSNLRQIGEKISKHLKHHPLSEVRALASTSLSLLKDKYPGSFGDRNIESRENYLKDYMQNYYYFDPAHFRMSNSLQVNFLHNFAMLDGYQDLMINRPERTELPKIFNEFASFQAEFFIDFGSYRDLQRQRSALQRAPLLTTKYGFESWYLEQLPANIRERAEKLIADQTISISNLDLTEFEKQYYIAMGFRVPNRFTIGLADLVYIAELRSGITVHPTARKIASEWACELQHILPELKLYVDKQPDKLDMKRGEQDILEKT